VLSLLSSGSFRSEANGPPNGPPNGPRPRGRNCRDRAAGRACRAVLWGAALFAISQFVLRIGIERVRPELRDPTFEIKFRALSRLRNKSPQPPATVLFLGSSMTAHGMKAGMVDEPLSAALGRPAIGFNMATSAAGPLTHLLYVQRLLRRGVRPDMIVLEASPLLYDYPKACSDLCRFPPETLGSGDLETVRRYSSDPDLVDDWRQAFLVPTYGHRLTILTQSAVAFVPFNDRLELWRDMDTHGWRMLSQHTAEKHQEVLADVKKHFTERLERYAVARADRVDLAALRELSALLVRERIATTMVEMPEGPLLRKLYRPEGLAEILSEFRTIAEEHGFQRIEAREDLDEDMFTDSYHLAAEGAEKLTARVLREAILPRMSSAR
jgi:hypothetical protein